MTVVTLVLASGRGTRLGGPKALLAWPHQGETIPLALAHARTRLAAESDRAIVVTRSDIAESLTPYLRGAELVISEAADEQGAAGSIAAAMGTLDALGDDAVLLVTPVDCPPADDATVRALLDRLRSDERLLAARPRRGTRGGHPVALRAVALAPYRADQPPPLRDRLRDLGTAVADVPVEDERVLADIDTEQDFASWGQGALSFVGRPR